MSDFTPTGAITGDDPGLEDAIPLIGATVLTLADNQLAVPIELFADMNPSTRLHLLEILHHAVGQAIEMARKEVQ